MESQIRPHEADHHRRSHEYVKLLLLSLVLFGMIPGAESKVHLDFQPAAGIQFPDSKILIRYYNSKHLVHWGGGFLFTNRNHSMGVFMRCLLQEVYIPSKYYSNDPVYHEHAILFYLGAHKSFHLMNESFWGRLGFSMHGDDLTTGDNLRMGIFSSMGKNLNITKHIGCFLELTYDYESVTARKYVCCESTRHLIYLMGKTFNAGGLQFNSGLSFDLN
jgi:hypothetical protein